jgi:hypothetical protein
LGYEWKVGLIGCGYRFPISTRPASLARSSLFGPGPSPARPGSVRAWTGFGQENRHGGLARHEPFTSMLDFFALKRAYQPA